MCALLNFVLQEPNENGLLLGSESEPKIATHRLVQLEKVCSLGVMRWEYKIFIYSQSVRKVLIFMKDQHKSCLTFNT